MIESLKNFFSQNLYLQKARDNEKNITITGTVAHKNSLLSEVDLFHANHYVKRSIEIIVAAVCSMKFKIMRNGKYDIKHPLYDFFAKPNGVDNWDSFLEKFATNYLLFGNAYLILMQNSSSNLELHNLVSQNVEVQPGANGVPSAYYYFVDGRKIVFENCLDKGPYIGHLKNFDPKNTWYGRSVLSSVKTSAALQNAIKTHNLSMLSNGGRPSGIINFASGANPLTEAQRNVLVENFSAKYQGPQNTGKIVFVEGKEFTWTPMSIDGKHMDYLEAQIFAGKEIASALGVPTVLIDGVSLQGESMRANFKEITNRFHEMTVLPLAQKIVNFLNGWLMHHFDRDALISIDINAFLPAHEKKMDLWEKVNASSFLSDKEKRVLLGVDQIIAHEEIL